MARQSNGLPEGVHKEKYKGTLKYRAYQWVPWWPGYPDGRLMASKRYPIETAGVLEFLEHWRENIKVEARKRQTAGEPLPIVVTGFAEDGERYIEAKYPPYDERGTPREKNPQYKECCRYVRVWVAIFGERDHATITPEEIRRQCNEWIARGPRWVYVNGERVQKSGPGYGLSPQEVNLRLRRLENMWTVLWRTEDTPVRHVDEYGEAVEAKPRGQTFAACYEVLAHMPDFTTAKKGELPEPGSLSRARFELMFLTGLEPKQIARLDEARDLDYQKPAIKLPTRGKGRSHKRRKRPRRILRDRPLIKAAVPAVRRVFALGANKTFSSASIGRAIKAGVTAANAKRAAKKRSLLPTNLRVKDWTRHTFGTEMYRETHDIDRVAEYLGHADRRMAEIYAESALHEHMLEAAAKMSALAAKAQGKRPGGEDGLTYASWRRRQQAAGVSGGKTEVRKRVLSPPVLSGHHGRNR
jgi:integrase